MALNLSTLTNASTSASILNEALTTADFLDPVPILKNLSRGSNKGGDAKQTTGLNQPRALPLIKNPSGNLGGYLYIPNVSGNYATGPSVTIGANQTWEGELDMVITQWGNYIMPMGGGDWALGFGILFYNNGFVNTLSKAGPVGYGATGITLGTPFNVKYGFNGTDIYADIDGVRKFTETASSQAASITHTLELNQQTLTNVGNYAIQKAKLTVNSAVVFDCDFNGSTSIRHGDTKFNCVGGPVSLTRAGQDPITVVKKGVLRFDGVNDALRGVFANNINGGYMFAAFSVLGTGGETNGRAFTINQDANGDFQLGGAIFGYHPSAETLRVYAGGGIADHTGLFDDSNRDILHEAKITNGNQFSKVNNADLGTTSITYVVNSNKFNIAANENDARSFGENVAIDLEYLALFDASLTTEQANSVRSFINKRNKIYLRHQTDGFYFFNPQKLAAGDVTSWNGNITGSDLGDTDVATNVTIVQGSQTSQPNADGYSLTFEDNTQHLEWASAYTPNFPAGQTKAWQIVGTSLGTFAYLTQGAVTELNLLGNKGLIRTTGQLYGIILLPESASSADIESARKLLIDRGAADGTSSSAAANNWYARNDIVEFKHLNTSSLIDFRSSFRNCLNLSVFPALELSNVNDFSSAWQGCSALTSFPAGAKLGTAAANVNFTSAWRQSGLTSFPADIDLSKGINFASTWRSSGLTSFPAIQSTLNGIDFFAAWYDCSSMVEFSLVQVDNAGRFDYAWGDNSSLTTFPANFFDNWNPGSIVTHVFHNTWDGCTSLTAQSVENILVSIDASGKYATTTGVSGGSALADAGIDIDYNVATGSLSAATNTAIDSLSGKGWEVYINGVLVIPNILDLEPAAAYSLRSFDANADPNVVNVRRSSDSALRDFKASEVSDGTLRDWTLGNTLALDGQRMYFDGVDDYVDLNQSLIPATGDFSVSLKYAHEEQAAINRYLLSQGNSINTFFALSITDNTVLCFVGGVGAGFFGTTSISKGSIYEFKVTRVGDVFTLYVDGVSVGTQTNVGLTISTNTNTYIGQATWTSGRFIKGTAYDIKKNGVLYYKGYGNTNADWTDQVGSSNATVNGSPALFSGQGFDGHVTTWYDQGGTNHASQPLVSNMPLLVDGGTLITEGGLAALDFDGTDDFLTNSTTIMNNAANAYASVVLSRTSAAASELPLSLPSGLSNGRGFDLRLVSGTEAQLSIKTEAGNASANGSFTTTSGSNVLLTGTFNSGLSSDEAKFFGNGSLVASASNSGSGIINNGDNGGLYIGKFGSPMNFGAHLNGKVKEVIIYVSDQSANRTGIENNINDHFDIYS